MNPIAMGAAVLAAAIHVWFFLLESVWFSRPSVWRRFGVKSEADAQVVRSFAFNQGFYNLFLGAGVIVGLVLVFIGDVAGGRAVALAMCWAMVGAGVVLVLHNRRFARAAAIQAVPQLVAILAQLLLG